MQLLHTMLRVGDMQRSIDFYTKVIGMDLLRTTERLGACAAERFWAPSDTIGSGNE